MLVVVTTEHTLLVWSVFHADTYDPPVHHIVPSPIDSYELLQEVYVGEEVLLDAGIHISRNCLEV